MAVGSPLSASIYDYFGSYSLLWVACAIIFAIAVFFVITADELSRVEYRKILGLERK